MTSPSSAYAELNMTLTQNALCVPSLSVTKAVPNTASAGAGGYWMKVWNTYGAIGVTEDMAWYWNGDVMTGKPCGYYCGLPETATHTDSAVLESDCWYNQADEDMPPGRRLPVRPHPEPSGTRTCISVSSGSSRDLRRPGDLRAPAETA